jgi:HK97 family phage prohead protease
MRTEEYRAAATLRAQQPEAMPLGAARSVCTGWQRSSIPLSARRLAPKMRATTQKKDGKDFYVLTGYFTMYELGYEMWDWAGPYTEIVSLGAGDVTIANEPDVVFLENHKGLAMARTVNGSLILKSDEVGGYNEVWLNPTRTDAANLVAAIEDGTVTEQSFAFQITKGSWSPDYSEYRINEFDINRGDTSAVNYGANPYTSIAARSRDLLDDLDRLPVGVAREALQRLQSRQDLNTASPARSAVPASTPAPVSAATSSTDDVTLDHIGAWLAAQQMHG